MLRTAEIRKSFLRYFEQQQHSAVASSPVVPLDDPTLLFTNAGMNQFKDLFLGKKSLPYSRATTSQKCIRAGGKHNDLENVGHTARHLTFFEMVGNFSFGDYFKEEAIRFAWEVATTIFAFPEEKLWASVFQTDDEAWELWRRYLPAEKICRFGEKENFWEMGDVGPCGPSSELFLDRGSAYGCAESPVDDPLGERYLEFWNLVFMQYNRQEDGSLLPLPKPSVDTGAGLERIAALSQGVPTVFATDLFQEIIEEIASIAKVAYTPASHQAPAFHVIADHLRSLSFAIADGAQPSNVERGYVLRKILRRAVRYGRQLGFDAPFLARLLPALLRAMGNDYPELITNQERIATLLTKEEESFFRTLKRGGTLLNEVIRSSATSGVISGDDAFRLKDTYGLPIDEITLLARDAELRVDHQRFELLEEEARERSRAGHKVVQQMAQENPYAVLQGSSSFVGYEIGVHQASVIALFVDGLRVDAVAMGTRAVVVLDTTPFYAQKGGQVGDRGHLMREQAPAFIVEDTQEPYSGVVAHHGEAILSLHVGDILSAHIDAGRRQQIAANHTATHLLHWALHTTFGKEVSQAGSLVDADRLRFDFHHHAAVSERELRTLEELVNAKVLADLPVSAYQLPYRDVKGRQDIAQFFDEKYGEWVRVVDIQNVSKELCGGTHLTRTGAVGSFLIVKEGSVAAGVRRIEAVTGMGLLHHLRASEQRLHAIASAIKSPFHEIEEKVEKLVVEHAAFSEQIAAFRMQELARCADQLIAKQEPLGEQLYGVVAAVQLASGQELAALADLLHGKAPALAVVLVMHSGEQCSIVVRLPVVWIEHGFSAAKVVQAALLPISGKGGGRPANAQGGGRLSGDLPAVAAVEAVLSAARVALSRG